MASGRDKQFLSRFYQGEARFSVNGYYKGTASIALAGA